MDGHLRQLKRLLARMTSGQLELIFDQVVQPVFPFVESGRKLASEVGFFDRAGQQSFSRCLDDPQRRLQFMGNV